MKVKELLNISLEEFQNFSKPELRKAVQTLGSAGNKRIDRIMQQNIYSPAVQRAFETGGRFSTKGKNYEELQREFFRAKQFLQSETGNVKGAKKYKKEVEAKTGLSFDDETFNSFSKMIEYIRTHDPDLYKIIYEEYIRPINQGNDTDYDQNYWMSKMRERYIELKTDTVDVGDFWEFSDNV